MFATKLVKMIKRNLVLTKFCCSIYFLVEFSLCLQNMIDFTYFHIWCFYSRRYELNAFALKLPFLFYTYTLAVRTKMRRVQQQAASDAAVCTHKMRTVGWNLCDPCFLVKTSLRLRGHPNMRSELGFVQTELGTQCLYALYACCSVKCGQRINAYDKMN